MRSFINKGSLPHPYSLIQNYANYLSRIAIGMTLSESPDYPHAMKSIY